MTLLQTVRSWIIASPELSTYLSEVDEELDAGQEAASAIHPPVPVRRLP